MHRYEVRIDTSNPDAAIRLIELLGAVSHTIVGSDFSGYRHTTFLTACNPAGDIMVSCRHTVDEINVLDGEVNAIAREIDRHGFLHDEIPDLIFGLATRLLAAADIADPKSDQPLDARRIRELVDELNGDDYDLDGTLPARGWIAAYALLVCQRIAESWTACLRERAVSIAHEHRVPTAVWRRAEADLRTAERDWPTALERIAQWLRDFQ